MPIPTACYFSIAQVSWRAPNSVRKPAPQGMVPLGSFLEEVGVSEEPNVCVHTVLLRSSPPEKVENGEKSLFALGALSSEAIEEGELERADQRVKVTSNVKVEMQVNPTDGLSARQSNNSSQLQDDLKRHSHFASGFPTGSGMLSTRDSKTTNISSARHSPREYTPHASQRTSANHDRVQSLRDSGSIVNDSIERVHVQQLFDSTRSDDEDDRSSAGSDFSRKMGNMMTLLGPTRISPRKQQLFVALESRLFSHVALPDEHEVGTLFESAMLEEKLFLMTSQTSNPGIAQARECATPEQLDWREGGIGCVLAPAAQEVTLRSFLAGCIWSAVNCTFKHRELTSVLCAVGLRSMLIARLLEAIGMKFIVLWSLH